MKHIFLKGNIPHNKDKTLEKLYGQEKANFIRNRMKEAGKKNKSNKRPDLSEYNRKFKPLQTNSRNGMYKKGYLISMEKNGNWQGGKSFEEYPKEFKLIKLIIIKRDNYKCRFCNYEQKYLREKLSVHHIDYNKQNCRHNNLISLCRKCHSFIGKNNNLKFGQFIFFHLLLNKNIDMRTW